ncbi:MAG: nucleotidyltransferase domain-containing protein [Solirubrobacteraceae bacterium]
MAKLETTSLRPRERRALDRMIELLVDEYGDELHAVWLYGSRARGEAGHEDSDVDLLVLTAGGRSRDSRRVDELAWQAAEEVGMSPIYLSVRVYDEEWLAGRREIRSFFIQEVDRDKVVLHGHA